MYWIATVCLSKHLVTLNSCNFHMFQVVAVGGIGNIVRVLTDRKHV